MFPSKKLKSTRGVGHAHKFSLRADALRDTHTQCSQALNTQLPLVIAERAAIHLSSSNGFAEFWPEPIKFLVDMLNYARWLRILKNSKTNIPFLLFNLYFSPW